MTKYILNSGNVKYDPVKNKKFIKEILTGLTGEIKVLYCLFAQPREDWETKFEGYKEGFAKFADKEKKLSFELAFPEKFERQVKNSDVILIQGGDDHLLQCWLRKFDLPKIWNEKVIATSSAGSNAPVASFWTCDWRECMKGLGLLPVKFIAHFASEYGSADPRGRIDWDKAIFELKKYDDISLPLYAPREGDFIVIEK